MIKILDGISQRIDDYGFVLLTKTPDVLSYTESFLKLQTQNNIEVSFSFDHIDTILDFFGRFFKFDCPDNSVAEFISSGYFLEILQCYLSSEHISDVKKVLWILSNITDEIICQKTLMIDFMSNMFP